MFERYTEKARRAIFFAHYGASQTGSPYIETEHLLLGTLHESPQLVSFPVDTIHEQIQRTALKREKVSASADLPLSNESKRVLAYAAEEAERLRHRHIGTEHLFLGLLREGNSRAANLLNERGITLDAARRRIARLSLSGSPPLGPGAAGGWSELLSRVRGYQRFTWQVRKWQPRDILVDRQTGRVMFYTGQEFDEAAFQLTRAGWKQDYCAICNWELAETDDPQHGLAYTNGRDWICTGCYDEFFQPPLTPLQDLYT